MLGEYTAYIDRRVELPDARNNNSQLDINTWCSASKGNKKNQSHHRVSKTSPAEAYSTISVNLGVLLSIAKTRCKEARIDSLDKSL